jgi:phosphate/sulfate permease
MEALHLEKNRWTVRDITLTAIMTAVVFLMTFLPKIPIPLGYAHLGDAAIFLFLCLSSRREAMLSACLGSAMADFLGGFPLWIQVVCAGTMAIGTAVGGKKIIKTVGMNMVKLEKYQGFAASVSATASLLVATLTGLPVSTTHTKTAAIMGAGAAKDVRAVNWAVAKDMVLTWVFTFPGCGLIGFLLAKLFLMVF